jgi:single stranded DNA-binding protein
MKGTLKLSLIEGILINDPKMVNHKSGIPNCKFVIEIRCIIKCETGNKEDITHIMVNTWNRLAEISFQYLKKGIKVRVKGRLKQISYIDKNDRSKKSKLSIEANTVDFFSKTKDIK